MSWIAVGAAAVTAGVQIYQGIDQKNKAGDLKKSQYIPPELLMNRDLANQQAFSRRAPGAAQAEEQNRRLQANQIAGAQRSFGGDANKIAAVASAATAQATDANARIAAQGQQFSENAFGRLSNANSAIARVDEQNQRDFIDTKNALNQAGDQNIFNGISNVGSAVALGSQGKQGGQSKAISNSTNNAKATTLANQNMSALQQIQSQGVDMPELNIDQSMANLDGVPTIGKGLKGWNYSTSGLRTPKLRKR